MNLIMDFTKKLGNCFFALFFLPFLLHSKNHNSISEAQPPYIKEVNEVVEIFKKSVMREFDIKYEGGGGSMPNDVIRITIHFASNECPDIDRARFLEIRLIEKFLEIINSHEGIRPYLRQYPFPVNGADIALSFAPRGKNKKPDSIKFIYQVRGRIFYATEDSLDKKCDAYTEKYETALEIVKSSSDSNYY